MTKVIKIQTQHGPREIEAEEIPGTPFVIHNRFSDSGDRSTSWAVTHPVTGYAACASCATKEQAATLAEGLAALGCDWGFTDPKDAKKIGIEHGEAIRALINAAQE